MRLRPFPVGSPGTLGLTVRLLLSSLRQRVSESSSLSTWSFPFQGLSPFIAFVPLLEALSESLTHSIPRSFLVVALSASAVGFADALWLCPERALRRFFASVSLFDPVTLLPLLHRVFTDGFRHWCAFRFCGGASPRAFGPVGGLGELRSPCTGPGWSPPICRVPLELRLVFYVLLCDIPPVFMAILWSVSLTPACPLRVIPIRGCSLDTCEASVWLDLLSSSALFQDSVICADLWSRQLGPDASCDRHSVALALSPSLTVVMTPFYCGTLGGLHVLVGSLTYPSPGRMFDPSCFGRLQCLEAGLTSRPLLALPGLCLMPDL